MSPFATPARSFERAPFQNLPLMDRLWHSARASQCCQSSSGVEQRTHKPLVGGSNPSSGTMLYISPLLNVIAPVPRRPVPAIGLTCQNGTAMNIEYTPSFGSSHDGMTLAKCCPRLLPQPPSLSPQPHSISCSPCQAPSVTRLWSAPLSV